MNLYFHSISYNGYQDKILDSIYKECPLPGKFFIDISKRINPSRFVARDGEWSLPWQQTIIPGFEMPRLDPTFKLSFEEVYDIENNDGMLKRKNSDSSESQMDINVSDNDNDMV